MVRRGTHAGGDSVGRVDKEKRTLKHYGKACADFSVNGSKHAPHRPYMTK